MTRTTGATDAQIEAAVERRRRLSLGYSDMSLMKSNMREIWAPSLVTTDHRIVRVDDLREVHNVALNFRERMVSIVLSDAINRAEGDLTQEQMDAISSRTRERWYNTYPEFADACARIESIIGEAE